MSCKSELESISSPLKATDLRRVNLVIAPAKVNAVLIEEMLIN